MAYDWMKTVSKSMLEISTEYSYDNIDAILDEANRVFQNEYKNIGYEYDIQKKENDKLQKKIDIKYKRAIKDFKVWISLISGVTGNLIKQFFEENEIKRNGKDEVSIKLFGRQLHVCNEIATLLENGFPDGAQARWRTLYELYVYMMFIAEFGDEIYSDFEGIERYWLASYLRKKVESNIQIDEIKKQYSFLLEKYGSDYASNLGWTKNILKNPKDRTIEKIALSAKKLDSFYHLAYKVASENIHGNMFGNTYKLGKNEQSARIIIEGVEEGINEPLVYSIDILFQSIGEIFRLANDSYSQYMYFFISVMGKNIKERIVSNKDS